MDIKYNDGNNIFTYSLNYLDISANPNYTNYKIDYKIDLFYGATKEKLDNIYIIINDLINYDMKLNIYYNITYDMTNNKYIIYNAKNDYSILDYKTEVIDNITYTYYDSLDYKLYILNNNDYKYKLIDNNLTEYYIKNNEFYPSFIKYTNGNEINITLTNHNITNINNNSFHQFRLNMSNIVNLNVFNVINKNRLNLKNDYYYSNNTFNTNEDISSIISNNSYLVKDNNHFYPLQNNLLGMNNEAPKNITTEAAYDLFYYDKDINNYALLLYGIQIEYNIDYSNNLLISFEMKLENRSTQMLCRFDDILIYRNSNDKIEIEIDNITYHTNIIMSDNTWYKIRIKITDKIYFYLDEIEYIIDNNYNIPSNATIILGYNTYYNNMITFGLIRNLYIGEIIFSYEEISKSDSYDAYNNLLNEEVRNDGDIIYSKNNSISIGTPTNYPLLTNSVRIEEIVNNKINSKIYFDNSRIGLIDIFITQNCGDGSTHNTRYIYNYDSYNRIQNEEIISVLNQNYKREYIYDIYNNITRINDINNSNNYEEFIYNDTYKYRLETYKVHENGNTVTYNITYDNNTGLLPISFMNNTYSYEGKRLISYNDYNYEYNIYGLRIRKYNNDIDIRYYYDINNKLILEDRGTYKIRYLYDSNSIYGFIKEDRTEGIKKYYYLKNKLGIIYGIINSEGELLGTYRYNAFGKILEVKVKYWTEYNDQLINECNEILNLNPIRYKSYYYDTESNMYYLNSRYYNPTICRFITPDSYNNIDFLNNDCYNLYVYCNNNPVMYDDPEGKMPEWLAWILSGAAIIGGIVLSATGVGGIAGGILIGAGAGSLIGGYTNKSSGGSFDAGYLGGMFSGAICGASAGLGGLFFAAASDATNLACIGYLLAGSITSFTSGFVGNMLGGIYTNLHDSGFKTLNIDFNELLIESFIVGGLNVFAGVASGTCSIVGNLGKTTTDVDSKLALRLMAGIIAGGTETAYDLSTYLINKLVRKLRDL